MLLARADVHQVVVPFLHQPQQRAHEIVEEHDLAPLLAVAPQRHRFAELLAADDLADQVEDEVHLPAIGVVAGPVERGGHRAQVAQPVLAVERARALVEHALGHRVGVEAVDRLAVHVLFLGQVALGRIRATRSHEHEFRLLLVRRPPREQIGVDLLVDHPLLPRMPEAEIPRLRPGGEVIHQVVALRRIRLEAALPRQVAAFMVQRMIDKKDGRKDINAALN